MDDVLTLEDAGPNRFRVVDEGDPERRDVVFGGQLLAQAIMAAARVCPGKTCRTIHAVFARSARVGGEPTELSVDVLHEGRTFATASVDVTQGSRACARLQVLLDSGDPDLYGHSSPMPAVTGPDESPDLGGPGLVFPGTEGRLVGGVDTWSVDAPLGPPELHLWLRHPGMPGCETDADVLRNQAALAWATDGFLIGASMRPHADMGQDLAHRTISTGVISHTIAFHEPFSLAGWVLIAHNSTNAAGGRVHGVAEAFTEGGTHVASYSQVAIVRAFDIDPTQAGGYRSVM